MLDIPPIPSRQGKESFRSSIMPAIPVHAKNLIKIYEGGATSIRLMRTVTASWSCVTRSREARAPVDHYPLTVMPEPVPEFGLVSIVLVTALSFAAITFVRRCMRS